MKGNEAEYTIGLRRAFLFPPLKRPRKALNEIKRFVKKHCRPEKTSISNEVNEKIFENSKNIPRRIHAVLFKEEEKITVFLKDGKQLKAYKEKMAKEKKDKEKKKKEAEKKKDDKKEETEQAEQKEKLEEKKAKEMASKASDIKRKTGK